MEEAETAADTEGALLELTLKLALALPLMLTALAEPERLPVAELLGLALASWLTEALLLLLTLAARVTVGVALEELEAAAELLPPPPLLAEMAGLPLAE